MQGSEERVAVRRFDTAGKGSLFHTDSPGGNLHRPDSDGTFNLRDGMGGRLDLDQSGRCLGGLFFQPESPEDRS
jgi:hypothetical protein